MPGWKTFAIVALATGALGACSTTEERASGVGVGAVAGAAVGGPVGAVAGGVVGGVTAPTVASATGVPHSRSARTHKVKHTKKRTTTPAPAPAPDAAPAQ